MASGNYAHVTPDGTIWKVTVNGDYLGYYPTQNQAWDAARDWLQRNGGGELNVHGANGAIRAKDTIYPGNDPRNSRG
jgi:hypothetical protein